MDKASNPRLSHKGQLLLKSLLISLGTGFLASILSPEMRVIYKTANKPAFAPPDWIFGPIWILLYILMGIAAYRVYLAGSKRPEVKDALFYYAVQLFLNFLWPVLFFRFALAGTAFLDIVLLFILVAITAFKFYRIDKTAGILMIPYILWLIFAAVLNSAFL